MLGAMGDFRDFIFKLRVFSKKLVGGARIARGTSDADVVQQGVQSLTDCKLQCVTTPACKGVEFAVNSCTLLTGADSWSQYWILQSVLHYLESNSISQSIA